jgi:hypothetical protein
MHGGGVVSEFGDHGGCGDYMLLWDVVACIVVVVQ